MSWNMLYICLFASHTQTERALFVCNIYIYTSYMYLQGISENSPTNRETKNKPIFKNE